MLRDVTKGLSLGRVLWNDLTIENLRYAYRKVEVNLKGSDHGKHVGLDGRMTLKWIIKDKTILQGLDLSVTG